MNLYLQDITKKIANNYFDKDVDIKIYNIFILIFLYYLYTTSFSLIPNDDFCRNSISFLYNYNYTDIFPYMKHISFSQYYYYDVFAGFLYKTIGVKSYIVMQLFFLFFYSSVYLYLLKGVSNNNKTIILFLSLIFISQRIYLVRPSFLLTIIMLLCLAVIQDKNLKEKYKNILCSLLCIVSAPFYHLFFLYYMPLLLFRKLLFIPILFGILFWYNLAGLEYFEAVRMSLIAGSPQVTIQMNELLPVWSLTNSFTLLIIFIPLSVYIINNVKTFFIIFWFLLPNAIRYFENVVPLSFYFFRFYNYKTPIIFVFLFVFLSIHVSAKTQNKHIELDKIQKIFKKGDYILNLSDKGQNILYFNPYVKYMPSFEPNFMDENFKKAYRNVNKTLIFNCKEFKPFRIDYVIENGLKNIPPCFELYDISNDIRIWKIKENVKT